MTSRRTALHALPLGWATDVEVLAVMGSEICDHGDHLVVRTPANPGYRWGNLLVVRDPSRRDDASHWLDRFVEVLPNAEHRSIGLPAEPDPAPWRRHGLRVESDEVLVADRPPGVRPLSTGYEVRRLVTDADWAQAVALEVADELASTPDQDASGSDDLARRRYRLFAERRWRSRAQASSRGDAAFFGVSHEGQQVAHLGIVCCSGYARYQSVLTHSEHRHRGLAAHLLGVAGSWADEEGLTRWLILVEPGSDAARLYRSVGFGFEASTWQVTSE